MLLRNNEVFRYFLAGAILIFMWATPSVSQVAEAPEFNAIEPNTATTTPGAKVAVTGSHLSPDLMVYFDGLQARSVTFINDSTLQVVTPYLRPGTYKLDFKSGEDVIRSELRFTSLSALVDSKIDRAEELASKKQTDAAIRVLADTAAADPDYDVRAYAHYRAAQLYLVQGDGWEAAAESALIWEQKVSMGVQTCWRYRLLYDELSYSLSESNDHDTDIRLADGSLEMDVTESSEPRFWRALMNARFGNVEKAKVDLKFILLAHPEDPSYRALSIYIDSLLGDKTQIEAFRGQGVNDARALRLLGQASYINGNYQAAQSWWAAEAKFKDTWPRLDYFAGIKHLKYGQVTVGAALIAECAAISPDTSEGRQAKLRLAAFAQPAP